MNDALFLPISSLRITMTGDFVQLSQSWLSLDPSREVTQTVLKTRS